jgi:hypothetical protein
MTYHSKYLITGLTAYARKKYDAPTGTTFTLYEGAKELVRLAKAGADTDILVLSTPTTWNTLISLHRSVLFYCDWRNEVRPMFTATTQEITALGAQAIPTPGA